MPETSQQSQQTSSQSNMRLSLGMVANTVDMYNGKYNPKIFFDNLELRSSLDNWTADDTLKILKLRLTGDALEYFKADTSLNLLNYEELKKKICKQFTRPVMPLENLLKLNNCYQRKDEQVQNYVVRLKKIGTLLLQEDTKELTEANDIDLITKRNKALILNQFKLGLRKEISNKIGVALQRTKNLTLEDAEEFARQQELFDNHNNTQHHVRTLNYTHTINKLPSQKSCYYCGIPGHFSNVCRKKQADERYQTNYNSKNYNNQNNLNNFNVQKFSRQNSNYNSNNYRQNFNRNNMTPNQQINSRNCHFENANQRPQNFWKNPNTQRNQYNNPRFDNKTTYGNWNQEQRRGQNSHNLNFTRHWPTTHPNGLKQSQN